MDSYLHRSHTTVAKGVAILLIIGCHLCSAVLPFGIARLTTPLGGTAVAIFLFLSGYGLNESQKQNHLTHYWTKKLKNVLVPYFVTFLVYITVMHTKLTPTEGILLLLTAKEKHDYYFWYVGYQFYCYFIFYWSIRYSSSYYAKYGVLMIGSVVSFCLFNELRAEQSLSFLLGVLASDCPSVKKSLQSKIMVFAALLVGVGMLALKQLPAIRDAHTWVLKAVQMAIKLSLAIWIIWFVCYVDKIKWVSRFLRWIGKYSYELYLAHAIAMLVLLYCSTAWWGVALFAALTVIFAFLLDGIRKIIAR